MVASWQQTSTDFGRYESYTFLASSCLTNRRLVCQNTQMLDKAQSLLHTFPRNFPVDGKVANFSATSCFNGIWETIWHSRHNGLLPAPTCYSLVADLLRGCRQVVTDLLLGTDVMDFGHKPDSETQCSVENLPGDIPEVAQDVVSVPKW